MAKEKASTRTILIEVKGGKVRRLVIPDYCHLTFGPVAIGAKQFNGESPNVLRVYGDAKRTNLLAVYRDVLSFHDEEVQLTERIIKAKTKRYRDDRANGGREYTAEVRRTVWRDPFSDDADDDDDDLTDDVLALPWAGEEVPS